MYNICKKTYNDGADGSHLCMDYTDLLADKYCHMQFIAVILPAVIADCCVISSYSQYFAALLLG